MGKAYGRLHLRGGRMEKRMKIFKLEHGVNISIVYLSYFYIPSEISSIESLKPWWSSIDSSYC